jgi:transposase
MRQSPIEGSSKWPSVTSLVMPLCSASISARTSSTSAALDAAGAPVQRATFRRETLLQFFERAAPTIVGMEACPGSQWLARKLQGIGHTVRIVPAKFVKPYIKSKNDQIDAEAIAEAVSRPTMRFVEVRSPEQVDLQALHRVRDRLVAQRTRVICQMRAFCLEYGIAMHQGAGRFKSDFPAVVADESNDLTPAMRRLLASLFEDVRGLEARIAEVTREIEDVAATDDTARRLMTIPGIGPLAATGLLAAAGKGMQFRKGRHMAAWLGLVPRENGARGSHHGLAATAAHSREAGYIYADLIVRTRLILAPTGRTIHFFRVPRATSRHPASTPPAAS